MIEANFPEKLNQSFKLRETLCALIVQPQEHEIDLAAVPGINVPQN